MSRFKDRNKEKLKLWVDQETFSEELFTPLHIAAFNGNIHIIAYLIDVCGANPQKAINNMRINPVHVAA